MISGQMTDAEVADQIARADRFIADFREMIAGTVVDHASACTDYQRRGLQRIASTLDAVPFVTMCNLANPSGGKSLTMIEPSKFRSENARPADKPWRASH